MVVHSKKETKVILKGLQRQLKSHQDSVRELYVSVSKLTHLIELDGDHLFETASHVEKEQVLNKLRENNGSRLRTARQLGWSRGKLIKRIERYRKEGASIPESPY